MDSTPTGGKRAQEERDEPCTGEAGLWAGGPGGDYPCRRHRHVRGDVACAERATRVWGALLGGGDGAVPVVSGGGGALPRAPGDRHGRASDGEQRVGELSLGADRDARPG